ncbi:histidine phosphatase family protein [Streptococcus cristatus]|uniref:Phosphoglycerate mutase family 2 n=1 Tax=Streptococcus cristatus TaxID=45634 RepID=A0A139MX08_STRCR|nr:histidine phosphatase family protein [Streptococcus cristatus]KXT68280.1 Phosphoglycerate mutase family 2 [Streptococcus cristatus]
MKNTYYFIRHAHSIYTPDEINRPLSDKGQASLAQLDFLADKSITAIYSSPYCRAIQTVEPLAQSLKLAIQTDKRLIERKLSSQAIADPDFEEALMKLWSRPTFSLVDGESNQQAQQRALALLHELESKHQNEEIIISSHGNLICILLSAFDSSIDYNFWRNLSMPDVLVLDKDEKITRLL